MTSDELFAAWGAAWSTRDSDERRIRLGSCCTDDVEFIPPDERPVIRGLDQLAAHVDDYTSTWPAGVSSELARPSDSHHGWSRGLVRWNFPAASAQGTDIIRIVDGKIATMLVFADPEAANADATGSNP